MIIDLFPTQNSPSGSGKDGSQQGNVALINGVIEAGKAMVSYEAACTMLMELVPIVADNKEEMALLAGQGGIKVFFREKKHTAALRHLRGLQCFYGGDPGG